MLLNLYMTSFCSQVTYTCVAHDKLVMQSLMMLACWVEDPHGEAFKKHISRVADYLWVAEDGITLQVSELIKLY